MGASWCRRRFAYQSDEDVDRGFFSNVGSISSASGVLFEGQYGLSSSYSRALSGSSDGVLRLWDLDSGEVSAQLVCEEEARSLDVDWTTQRALTVSQDPPC